MSDSTIDSSFLRLQTYFLGVKVSNQIGPAATQAIVDKIESIPPGTNIDDMNHDQLQAVHAALKEASDAA